MRLVGQVNDAKTAEKFIAFLETLKIEAQARDGDPGAFEIWAMDEDRLAESQRHFDRFQVNPNATEFNVARPTSKAPSKKECATLPYRNTAWNRSSLGRLPVTYAVIGICTILAFFAIIPGFQLLRGYLYFSEQMGREFFEIREGQIWRLVTPVFLHGNPLHLFFNMLWMYQLGGEIETEDGSIFLSLFLITTAIVCNVAQYLVSGPAFVGLSGVVYAFLSYIWIMARRSLSTHYAMNDQTLMVMLVWLFICLVGIIPSVANTEHVVGLLFGLGWGWLRSQPPKRRLKPKI